jgi:ribosomal protein S18 acetylase RimI-like enzyme
MIRLRSVQPEDRDFLLRVYASVREEELAPINWTREQKDSFVQMQFEAQTRFYEENYIGAKFQVILADDVRAGRLYIHPRANEIRIMDIALLPEFRGRGIGFALLNEILDEARAANQTVSIHVERMNPALHLYERLGFCLHEDKGVYLLLEWTPLKTEVAERVG